LYDKKDPAGVTYYDPEKVYNGYTLFTPLRGDGTIYLIDMKGKPVHKWKMPAPATLPKLLPNGNLLCDGRTDTSPLKAGGAIGLLFEVSWDGKILWKYKNDNMHHDYFRRSNGNTLVLLWEKIPQELANKVKGGIASNNNKNKVMWSDRIIEIEPSGKTIWDWHAYDHLDPQQDFICPICARGEWTHGNAVFETKNGDILTSFRQIDTVGIIDKNTGDWKWKWGRGKINHQHDPTELENGNILLFDNGTHKPHLPPPPPSDPKLMEMPPLRSPASRILEVDPKTNDIVWEYFDTDYLGFYSDSISGVQRLPNGNNLICSGNQGRLFEVTPKKEIVWEYFNPYIGEVQQIDVFRAYRYGLDYPGIKL